MTPAEAVQQLVTILSNGPTKSPSEDQVYDALKSASVPDDIADRAYKFTQIACGRKFLDGMGIEFSDEYVCFNRNGEVMDTGKLQEEPYFRAAVEAAGPEKMGGEVFGHFAAMSAEVDAVNNALKAGSNAADLVMVPSFLFLEVPTKAGFANAQRMIQRYIQGIRDENPQPRPWWKFW